jgi:hypothetical protein
MTAAVQQPTDNCAACLTPERAVTVQPYLVQPDERSGVRAYYRCPECGFRWWTSWALGEDSLFVPFPERGAA